jgi:D-tagatose-1,6-bisphosphate aldolase subunit GatZ/KbaZ
MRYYWPDPEIETALARLMDNLTTREIPDPLLSAFLPLQYERVRRGSLDRTPRELVIDRVRDVLRTYAAAATPGH